MKLKNIIVGLLGINLVIAVHELGHWSLCKVFNVATPEFSIGFGPQLYTKKFDQTTFVLRALPIGGYVEIEGMRSIEPGLKQQSFIAKPFSQQLAILLGGILFNILFALLMLLFFGYRPIPIKETATKPKKERGLVGPIGIIRFAAESASHGIQTFFFFLGVLSLNLAIFNLLPLPILDGGQIILYASEALAGRTINPTVYTVITTLTTFFLIFMLLKITRRDIKHISQ